jgi:uncharacterized membrane protein
VVNILSKVSFGLALALSSLVSLMLLSALLNFGFGPILAGGPVAVLIVAAMLLNPVVFGLLGLIKASSRRRLIAAGSMFTLILLVTLHSDLVLSQAHIR